MIQIPWPSGASWTQEVAIDGRVYRMAGRWNEIGEFWSFDFLTLNREPIIMGIKVTLGRLLTRQAFDDRLPAGDFLVVTNDETPGRPLRDDMVTNARLIYVPTV